MSNYLTEAAKYTDTIMDSVKSILDKNDITYKEIDPMNLIVSSTEDHPINSDEIRALTSESAGCDVSIFDALIDIVDVNDKVYIRQILK